MTDEDKAIDDQLKSTREKQATVQAVTKDLDDADLKAELDRRRGEKRRKILRPFERAPESTRPMAALETRG